MVIVASSDLKYNLLDLQDLKLVPEWCLQTIASGHVARMPNPDRALAGGLPIYSSFIDVFGDDVSGNRSKSWNKHWNTYFTHRNLPRKLLHQQCHIHFVSTSTHATVPEQFDAIKEVIEKTHREPLKTQSAIDGHDTLLKIYCNCGPGDNPAQSEVCGHIGGQGNHPCRKCKVGGTQKEKETDVGFRAFFVPGEPRSSEDTLKEVEKQVNVACLGVAQSVKDLQTDSGIKDAYTQYWIDQLIERSRAMQKSQPKRPVNEIQAELMRWVDEKKSSIFNPFLTLKAFDVSLDTPVEILHTILLGVVKYAWYGSHSTWNDSHKKKYSERLQGTDVLGLSIHPIRSGYIMQYANSLIGRQLKTLAQVNTFHVYDLVGPLQFSLTKAIGELSALLWFPEILNLEEYLDDVETAAANVLDIAALIDPSKIIAKIKYHLLAHLRQDIIRHGPLVGVATETFECFNAIFRFCSILSNHLAPSRDIALQLAEQEVLRHLLSGGRWKAPSGDWKQPGPSITKFLEDNTFLASLLGYGHNATAASPPSGTVKLEPLKRTPNHSKQPRSALLFSDTQAAKAINVPEIMKDLQRKWHRGKHVVSHAQDECTVGAWIYAKSPVSSADNPVTGKVLEILQDESGTLSFVVIDVFQVHAIRHEYFGVPILSRRMSEVSLLVVPAKTVMFQYNVQHDCRMAHCVASGKRPVIQERIQTELTEPSIEHKPHDIFLINLHAFHNAHLIRAVLPRNLTQPIPYITVANREAQHAEIAATLRNSQKEKRQKAAEKKKVAADLNLKRVVGLEAQGPTASGSTAGGTTKRRRQDADHIDNGGDG